MHRIRELFSPGFDSGIGGGKNLREGCGGLQRNEELSIQRQLNVRNIHKCTHMHLCIHTPIIVSKNILTMLWRQVNIPCQENKGAQHTSQTNLCSFYPSLTNPRSTAEIFPDHCWSSQHSQCSAPITRGFLGCTGRTAFHVWQGRTIPSVTTLGKQASASTFTSIRDSAPEAVVHNFRSTKYTPEILKYCITWAWSPSAFMPG